jgi:hypothetical protein
VAKRDPRNACTLDCKWADTRPGINPNATAFAFRPGGPGRKTDVNVDKAGDNVTIRIGSGVGRGKVLLIGFDYEHTTKIGRGENGGRTLAESNVVRSIRPVGEWSGKPLEISERFSEGQDAAVVIESADGGIVGAARLSGGSTR